MTNTLYITLSICVLMSCTEYTKENTMEKWKQEILQTESDFAEMVQNEGLHKAFITYAADNAVLMRNNSLIIGKKNIDIFYKDQNLTGLSWRPDFIDVAKSGDLGYTYGKFTFTHKDTNDNQIKDTGVFHTVWKKQPDGSWRFVWD